MSAGDGALARARIVGLRAESTETPLALDRPRPGLSWRLESTRPAFRQTAYRILVAESPDALAMDRGDCWDSGRAASDDGGPTVYDGRALIAGRRYHWKVAAWDERGAATEWSAPSWWQMGPLAERDWTAEWMGVPSGTRDGPRVAFDEANWIWPSGPAKRSDAAEQPTAWFRRVFELPHDRPIRDGMFGGTASGPLRLFVNGHGPWRSYARWRPLQFDATLDLVPGRNVVTVMIDPADQPWGLIGRMVIRFSDGGWLDVTTDDQWSSSWSTEPPPVLDLDGLAWAPAVEVGHHGDAPWPHLTALEGSGQSPYLRTTFEAADVRRATLLASALGVYTIHLNGERVGDSVLTPGWTDYRKRIQYQAFDVSDRIHPGRNALGVILADGWYAGHVGAFARGRYGVSLAALVQLEIESTDGSVTTIISDRTWRSATGAIQAADLLMGEVQDRRREPRGWTTPGYDDSNWASAIAVDPPAGRLVAQPSPLVRITQELSPVSVSEVRPGAHIFDLGQNIVGWTRLRVRAKAGTRVVVRHAEMLDGDGSLYTANLRNARQTERYTLAGVGEELLEPSFTYHGFRFVEVSGVPGQPRLDDLRGCVVGTEMPSTGSFVCSNPLVNRLHENIAWSFRGNAQSVPTDCPQRDERLGWTGDVLAFAQTAGLMFPTERLFTKWLDDLADAQLQSGAFPDVAPHLGAFADGTAAWGDAGISVPWTLYLATGDVRILERHYESMTRWLSYLESTSSAGLRPAGRYGDWLAMEAETPRDLIATAYFVAAADQMVAIARVLDRARDSATFAAIAATARDAFQAAYLGSDGRIVGATQTGYVLALAFDLVPAADRAACARRLVEDIRDRDWHLSTGFLGTVHILPALARNGHLDVAYRLLEQETFPSWLYPVTVGATTTWERWDSWTVDAGFADPSMNSFNHYAFGAVGEWLYRYVAGIRPDPAGPGYKRIIIRPQPGGSLTHARAEIASPNGTISSAWRLDGSRFHLQVEIPPNSTATVWLPTAATGTEARAGRHAFVSELALPAVASQA